MNERRLSLVFCRFRYVALDLANEPMPLSVGRSQRFGQAWDDDGALLVGVSPFPAISPYHVAIRPSCIRAQVKQKKYGHTPTFC